VVVLVLADVVGVERVGHVGRHEDGARHGGVLGLAVDARQDNT
jgi:hypothetical protein